MYDPKEEDRQAFETTYSILIYASMTMQTLGRRPIEIIKRKELLYTKVKSKVDMIMDKFNAV